MKKFRISKKDYGYRKYWIVSGGDLKRAIRFGNFQLACDFIESRLYVQLQISGC